MKQLNFFELSSQKSLQRSDVHYWKLFCDGAARNNPGPAGVGIAIFKDEDPVGQYGFFVGSKTNNQAEYLALIIGLLIIKKLIKPIDIIHIISDSELMVRHLKGIYRVKNPELKPLFIVAQKILTGLNYDIGHVLRHKNKQADALANRGIDKQERIPEDLLRRLQEYGISL